jgi:hypothetical protein
MDQPKTMVRDDVDEAWRNITKAVVRAMGQVQGMDPMHHRAVAARVPNKAEATIMLDGL